MLTLTVQVQPKWRKDAQRVNAVQRYAMLRYTKAWAVRNLAAADHWFASAERAGRLLRIALTTS